MDPWFPVVCDERWFWNWEGSSVGPLLCMQAFLVARA